MEEGEKLQTYPELVMRPISSLPRRSHIQVPVTEHPWDWVTQGLEHFYGSWWMKGEGLV